MDAPKNNCTAYYIYGIMFFRVPLGLEMALRFIPLQK